MMLKPPTAAFAFEGMMVPLEKLLPTRLAGEKLKESAKFRSLLSSIREVGIIEPLNVFAQKGGKYLILDGHSRVEALRELGITEAPCLFAKSEEGYTYNQKVNRIAPIQANRMILKALKAGVPLERIARSLNLKVNTVRRSQRMLEGICPEAVELLRDKEVAAQTLALMKKVKPMRQIEMAEIMVAAGTYSGTYAHALVLTTPKAELVKPEKRRKSPEVDSGDLGRVEEEIKLQERDFRMLDEAYNENVMALTLARGYLRSLLANGKIVRFLAQNFREFLAEFQRIAESTALDKIG